jgi:hypothetical protein
MNMLSYFTIDLFYDTGAILTYGMLRGQTDKHLNRKNYKNLIFKAIKSCAIHKIHNMYLVRAIQHNE